MGYREWLPARGRRRAERTAAARRAMVRVLTRLSADARTRPIGEVGLRVLFDRLAPDWERIRADPVYRESFAQALAGIPRLFPAARRPRRALDVACGTGMATSMLVERLPGADVVGVDISPRMVDRARELVAGASFVVGSATRLPFDDASFDLVASVDGVFEVDELARVCGPGGVVVIVYSRGGSIPVSRPVDGLGQALGRAGFEWHSDAEAAWVVWGYRAVA